MICNCIKQIIKLSQKAYIIKICNKFIYLTNAIRLFIKLIEIPKLYPIRKDKIIFDFFRILYQCKVGLFLYTIITTRPDIAFLVSCFFKFNQRPGSQHHKAKNQVFYYLFLTQNYFICYKREV